MFMAKSDALLDPLHVWPINWNEKVTGAEPTPGSQQEGSHLSCPLWQNRQLFFTHFLKSQSKRRKKNSLFSFQQDTLLSEKNTFHIIWPVWLCCQEPCRVSLTAVKSRWHLTHSFPLRYLLLLLLSHYGSTTGLVLVSGRSQVADLGTRRRLDVCVRVSICALLAYTPPTDRLEEGHAVLRFERRTCATI